MSRDIRKVTAGTVQSGRQHCYLGRVARWQPWAVVHQSVLHSVPRLRGAVHVLSGWV